MAHDTDEGAPRAWYERGLQEGRKQAAFEQGLAAGRSGQQPEAVPSSSSPAHVAATMAALTQAAGLQGSTGPSATTGATPAPAAAAAGEMVDWDAVATSLNAKTEAEAARAGRRVAYGRSR